MLFKFTKSDKRLILLYFIVVMPLTWTLDYEDYDFQSTKGVIRFFTENALFVVLGFTAVYLIVYKLIARFLPQERYMTLFFTILAVLLFVGGIDINYSCFVYECKGLNPMSWRGFYYGMLNQIENIGILAGLLLGKKVMDLQLNVARIEKEKKEGELQLLKAQIDPHFLFNNLNTVDALIDSNPQKAKLYLHKLGQLYRYLISSKDQEVIEIEEELDFATNYIFLLEERFGGAFLFEKIDKRHTKNVAFIPPGALQTLLENVVKHNHATAEQPIKTRIIIEDDFIIVENDMRQKFKQVDSMGTGLKNLKKRYKLLTDNDLDIRSDTTFFVKLPSVKMVE